MAAVKHNKHRPQKSDDRLVRLSKSLSWLLRHGANSVGLTLLPGGFLWMSDVMKQPRLRGFTLSDVEEVVNRSDKKKRFFMMNDPDNGQLKIRANQGHSMEVDGLDLTQITDSSEIPTVVHGTNMGAWKLIKTQGLNRMNRIHIHFAVGLPGDEGVISGMRVSANVMVYIDVPKALQAGVTFFRSANNAILSPGLDGIIPPSLFSKVVLRSTGEELPFDKTDSHSEPNVARTDNGDKGSCVVTADMLAEEFEKTKRKGKKQQRE